MAYTFALNCDGFSDIYNNSFHRYIIDPCSPLKLLSNDVDIFSIMEHQQSELSALCNPPFATELITRFTSAVRVRCHRGLATNIVYIGPEHRGLHQLHGDGLAHCLAFFPEKSLPFVHCLTGMMRGFPKPIHMWWMGNTRLPDTRCIVTALKKLRKTYPLAISNHLYDIAPCRIQRQGWLNQQWATLLAIQEPYKFALNQQGRLSWKEILPLYVKVRAAARFLPICDKIQMSFPHVQWQFDLQQTGYSCVYLIVCTVCSNLYVGSTVQAPWDRFKQELSDARRARHFCKPPHWRHRMNLSDHMVLHGLGNSISFILEAWPGTNESWIRTREWQIMRRFTRQKLLNTYVPHAGRVTISPKTLTLCRQGVLSILSGGQFAPILRDMEKLGIRNLVNRVITSQRVQYDSRTLLLLHEHMMKFFQPTAGTVKYFRYCMLKRLRVMGLRLPQQLLVKGLQLQGQEITMVRSLLHRYVKSLPLHPLVHDYYISCLTIVKTQSKPLGDILFSYQRALRGLTWTHLKEKINTASSQCPCALLGRHLPRYQGHVLFRPTDLPCNSIAVGKRQLTTSMISALQQNMRGVPRLSAQERWKSLCSSLKQFQREVLHSAMAKVNLLHEARMLLSDTAINHVGADIVTCAQSAMHMLSGCICGPLDKNPTGLWICCQNLYYTILHDGYLASAGLGGFQHFPQLQDATHALMDSIRQYNMVPYCRRSALTSLQQHKEVAIPNLYLLLKNKSFPQHASGVKSRPITSHRKHPFKVMAARFTRGLTILLRMAVQVLRPSLSMLCLDLFGSQKLWETALQRFQHTPPEHLQLFEFDLDSMYYQIDQPACLQAVKDFFHMFKDLFKRRTVAISHQNRSLDRVGSGSRELYTNIPIVDIITFCEFELLGNSVARVGSICYRQTVGIPMGGIPSAPLANIYLLMREIACRAMHISRDFFYFRYLDNLPGVIDLRFTSLAEVKAVFLCIYRMPLKLEQSGCSIDTLEMRIAIIDGQFQYSSKPLLADQVGHTIDGTVQRVPPLWCEKRSRFLGYYVPSAFLKCVRYSSNFTGFLIGVENLVQGLLGQNFALGSLLAVIKHVILVKALPYSLFQFLSHLLRLRLDMYPG